jgi:hypothetical protein
MSTEFIRQ